MLFRTGNGTPAIWQGGAKAGTEEDDEGGVEESSTDPGSDIVGSDIVRIGRERAAGPSAAQRALYAWLQR